MDVGGATRWSAGAVVSRREMLDAARAALRARHPDRRTVLGPGGSLPAAGRHRLRHHLVDDRAVLRELRSQPADRRRRVADVSLRAAPAPTCAVRCARARPPRSSGTSIATVWASARRPRRRRTPEPRERATPLIPVERPQEGRAPRDAHAGGVVETSRPVGPVGQALADVASRHPTVRHTHLNARYASDVPERSMCRTSGGAGLERACGGVEVGHGFDHLAVERIDHVAGLQPALLRVRAPVA